MLSNVPMLRAGDVLLVCFEREPTEEEARRFTEQMHECLPGVRIAYVTGATGLAAFRPTPQPDDENCEYPTIGIRGE